MENNKMIRNRLNNEPGVEYTTTASGRDAKIISWGFTNGEYWYRLYVDGEKVAFGTLPKIDRLVRKI